MTEIDSKGREQRDAAVDALATRLAADIDRGKTVRRQLPDGGLFYMDRPLPFLCAYRQPPERPDPGTVKLVTGEAAYLRCGPSLRSLRGGRRLTAALAAHMAERLGGFLVIEVWSAAPDRVVRSATALSPRPGFRIHGRRSLAVSSTLHALERALGRIRILKHHAHVEIVREDRVAPPGRAPLLPAALARRAGIEIVGLEVQPIYRNEEGNLFPVELRLLRRQLGVALRKTFHGFTLSRTRAASASFRSLGRRSFVKAVWDVDSRLSSLAGTYDFLLDVTPVNLEAAWNRFRRDRYERDPVFFYRPLPVDPALVKRELMAIPIERIEDPTLSDLFREKQIGVDRELGMLLDRGTRRFLWGSLQVFGEPSDELAALARQLIDAIRPRRRRGAGPDAVGSAELAGRARAEVAAYRREFGAFSCRVDVRDDIYSGLMVSRGDLLIGRKLVVPRSRVEALLQHEVGTHALTYHNARAQRFKLLAAGLPGYDELQEGIAVFSEYLAGGLSRSRLRMLAARVVATGDMIGGATFVEAYRSLTASGFSGHDAFTVVARVFRGGGLTKDAVYLRGLVRVLDYLRGGGDLELLFIGKIDSRHVAIARELRLRGVLEPPPVLPRYLEGDAAAARLRRARSGIGVLELTEGA